MKVALILPHSKEIFYYKEYGKKYVNSKKFMEDVLCNKDDVEDRVAKALLDVGLQPTLYNITYQKPREEFRHKYGHRIVRTPIELGLKIYGSEFSLSLLKELSKEEYDVVHVLGSYYLNPIIPDLCDVIAFFCHHKEYPFIFQYGGGSFNSLLPLRRWIKKIALRWSDKILCQSKTEVKVLKNIYGIDEKKIVYLRYYPLNLKMFSDIPKETSAKRLNKDPKKHYILYVGYLRKHKGIFHLINVLPSLLRHYPEIELIFVGFGPEKNELQKLVKNKGLEDHVSFEGLVFHETLRFYYNLADVLVLPSYTEGTPNVILEAMACNTPCIATNVGGIPDILSEGGGVLIPPRDDGKLLRAILKVLNKGFEINKSKKYSLLNECSMETVGGKLKELYQNLGETHHT